MKARSSWSLFNSRNQAVRPVCRTNKFLLKSPVSIYSDGTESFSKSRIFSLCALQNEVYLFGWGYVYHNSPCFISSFLSVLLISFSFALSKCISQRSQEKCYLYSRVRDFRYGQMALLGRIVRAGYRKTRQHTAHV